MIYSLSTGPCCMFSLCTFLAMWIRLRGHNSQSLCLSLAFCQLHLDSEYQVLKPFKVSLKSVMGHYFWIWVTLTPEL